MSYMNGKKLPFSPMFTIVDGMSPEDAYQTFAGLIVPTVQGANISLNDRGNYPLRNLKIFGKSTQNGTPSPTAPIDVVHLNGVTLMAGENQIVLPYELKGIPVKSDGNYTDANGQQWLCDEIDFEKGAPVALDGVKMSAKNIILKLNELGGANGIGILDIVENRLVGMKCRGVYETPGGAILYKAHSVLETLCLDKYTMHEKQKLAITYGELVYNGQWFTPLREALAAFVDKTQEKVNGKVRLKLYKGNMINAGVWSDDSLYSEEIATFGESDYNQKDAEGFINLFGLPIKVAAMVEQGKK